MIGSSLLFGFAAAAAGLIARFLVGFFRGRRGRRLQLDNRLNLLGMLLLGLFATVLAGFLV